MRTKVAERPALVVSHEPLLVAVTKNGEYEHCPHQYKKVAAPVTGGTGGAAAAWRRCINGLVIALAREGQGEVAWWAPQRYSRNKRRQPTTPIFTAELWLHIIHLQIFHIMLYSYKCLFCNKTLIIFGCCCSAVRALLNYDSAAFSKDHCVMVILGERRGRSKVVVVVSRLSEVRLCHLKPHY